MSQPTQPQSRAKRFFGGLTLTYGYQAVLMVTGIWLTPFFLGHIGQHDYGLWLVGTQLLTYLSLTDFGVVALLPLETAYATGRAGGVANAKDLPDIIGQSARMVLYQLPIVVTLAVILWWTIPTESQLIRGPLGIVLVGFVLSFPLRIMPAILQGLQDLAFNGSMQMANWTLTTVTTVAMVLAGWSLYALAVGWLISQLALAPLYLYRLWTRFPGVLPRRLPSVSWQSSRPLLEKGFWISLGQVAQMLVSNTDLLIIGKLLGSEAVVPYACTGKLAAVLANQANILMQEATPGLCEVKAGESREKLFRVMTSLSHGILAFSGVVFSVVVIVNHWFVNWWVTQHQYGGLLLTAMILTNITVRHWSTTTAYSVFCFGHQRRISLTNLADGVITAAAAYVLVGAFGLPGAPAGSLIGACFISLPLNLRVIASETGATVRRLVSATMEGWAWRFVLVAGSVLWLASRWSPKNVFEAAGAAFVVGGIYFLVMLPSVMRSPLGEYIRNVVSEFRLKIAAFQMTFPA